MAEARPSRVALVTGGGRGIGRELAIGLARHGLAVGVLGRDVRALTETVRECQSHCVAALGVQADVTDQESVDRAIDDVAARLGPVDLLVNNAGRVDSQEVGFVDADIDDVLGVIEVNLNGTLRVLHAVLPRMRAAGRGRVLNVNSGFAYRRDSAYTGYSVAKGALARVTDMLALQLIPDGIVLVDVSPGLIRTDMTESMPMWENLDRAPWGDPARIVEVACALADGNLDALSGRFIHSAIDDLDDLAARADQITAADARRLRLAPYSDDDPLA